MSSLKNIEMRYSPLLVELLVSMLTEDENKQISIEGLVRKLEGF